MTRVLLLIILLCLVYWVVTRLIASYRSSQSSRSSRSSRDQSNQDNSDQQSDLKQSNLKIVQCSRCGCHVPENESHLNNEQVICNSAQCNENQ